MLARCGEAQLARMNASAMRFGVTTQVIFPYAEIEGYRAVLAPKDLERVYPVRTVSSALDAFLHTPGGAALIAHLREKDVLVTTNAVHGSPDRREYRCGYAAGFRDTVAYLVTLSTPPVAHAGTEPSEGAADLLARLAP